MRIPSLPRSSSISNSTNSSSNIWSYSSLLYFGASAFAFSASLIFAWKMLSKKKKISNKAKVNTQNISDTLFDKLMDTYPTDVHIGDPDFSFWNICKYQTTRDFGFIKMNPIDRPADPNDDGNKYRFHFIQKFYDHAEIRLVIVTTNNDRYIGTAYYLPKSIEELIRLYESLKTIEGQGDHFSLIAEYLRTGKLFTYHEPINLTNQDAKKEEKGTRVVGTDDITDSQPAPGYEIPTFSEEKYSKAIGYLQYAKEQEWIFLSTAFLVSKDGIIMTARHALNGLSPSQLQFFLPEDKKSFRISEVLELGEYLMDKEHNPHARGNQHVILDYALLRVKPRAEIQMLPAPLELTDKPVTGDANIYYIIGYESPEERKSHTLQFSTHESYENLGIFFHAPTTPGFSGAPIINILTHQVVGLHSRTTLQPIAQEERTGLSIAYCAQYYPNSALCLVLKGQDIPESNPLDFTFSEVTSVLEGFTEREEKSCRLSALGPTPALGSSHTYRCMLARWLLKGEDKIKFKDIDDGIKITFIVARQAYKIAYSCRNKKGRKVSKSCEISKSMLENQASGSSIEYDDAEARFCINRFFSPEYWQVKIKKTKDDVRVWVDLMEKNSNQPAINMGHKLGACPYWLFGSKNYQKERLQIKKDNAKYKNKNTLYKAKQEEYKKRYGKYEEAGYLNFGRSINGDFMRDPKNYRFEWHSLNKSEGAKSKSEGQYTDECPPGLKEDNGKFIPG